MTNKTITHKLMNKWNKIIDCPCGCRSSIKKELFFNYKKLKPDMQIRLCYLRGKFHFHGYKNTNQIDSLENANSFFDEAFTIGWKTKTKITSAKLWFKRAHTKMVLSKKTISKQDSNFLFRKAESIVNKALGIRSFRDNESLVWLQSEIQSLR